MVALVLPKLYIDPPDVEPYEHGLFGAAKPIDMPSEKWLIGGVHWLSEAWYQAQLSRAGLANNNGLGGTKGNLPASTPATNALPFNVYAGVLCASISFPQANEMAKTLRILELSGQHAAELALWTGQGVSDTALTPPPLATLTTATTGGTLAAGTYGYRVSAVNVRGESLAGAESTVVTTGTTSTTTLTWLAVPGAASYNVYGRTAAGEHYMTSVTALTFTDTGAITPTAQAVPATDQTAITGEALNATSNGVRNQLVSNTAQSITRALGLLEEWLGNNYSGRGFIHAGRRVAPAAMEHQQIRIANNDAETAPLVTSLGTRWIFGGGYNGTGPGNAAPGANQAWIYATGQVSMYRDAPELPIDDYAVTINRSDNSRFLIAEQQYITTIDGPIGAALVDLTL